MQQQRYMDGHEAAKVYLTLPAEKPVRFPLLTSDKVIWSHGSHNMRPFDQCLQAWPKVKQSCIMHSHVQHHKIYMVKGSQNDLWRLVQAEVAKQFIIFVLIASIL